MLFSDLKEDLFTGPRTTLEYLVVGEIIKFCLSNVLECERDGIVPTLYTIVVNYALAINSTVPLGHKSVDEVHKIEREYHHNINIYQLRS